MRSTKIVCTIGPATQSPKVLADLMKAGMNVARLNFSHGSQASHLKLIQTIRDVSDKLGLPIAILQDLAGPKIRLGEIDGKINLRAGQTFVLTSAKILGDDERASVSYSPMPKEVQAQDHILLADGSVELQVSDTDGTDIVCRVLVGGELSSHKGINLPGRTLSVSALTEKDKADLRFGIENDVEYVALSFVRRESDLMQVRTIMEEYRKRIPVIAKIEKHEALDNIDEIVKNADGIMVARGDLAIETALERVPLVQKMLIQKCIEEQKPVITATQMLKSMVDSPRPTRAEANDVANAVLDGTDAVMLSEETTIGKYPVEAVKTMARIIKVMEDGQTSNSRYRRGDTETASSIGYAICRGAIGMAEDLKAAAILTPTQSGSTARLVSSFRPKLPIIALGTSKSVVRALSLVWGVYPIVSAGYYTTEEMMEEAKDLALRSGLVSFDDMVILTAGVPAGVAGTTNIIKAEVLR